MQCMTNIYYELMKPSMEQKQKDRFRESKTLNKAQAIDRQVLSEYTVTIWHLTKWAAWGRKEKC